MNSGAGMRRKYRVYKKLKGMLWSLERRFSDESWLYDVRSRIRFTSWKLIQERRLAALRRAGPRSAAALVVRLLFEFEEVRRAFYLGND